MVAVLGHRECPVEIIPQAYPVSLIVKSFLHPDYYQAKSLEAVMTKAEALSFWKQSVDRRTQQRPDGNPNSEPSILLSVRREWPNMFKGSFDMMEVEGDDGRAQIKVTRCKWNEALRECEDLDYGYAIACHYDFEAFRKENPNFRLTRKQTLLTGAKYCDFCIHDLRRHNPNEHPGEKFWEGL